MLAAAVAAVQQYIIYRKTRKIYKSEYARLSLRKRLRKLLPLIPGKGSNRYAAVEGLIVNSGFNTSVEEFYLYKTLLFIVTLGILTSIQTTNAFIRYNNIVSDFNIGRTVMDSAGKAQAQDILKEEEMLAAVEKEIPKQIVPLRDLRDEGKYFAYIIQIEAVVSKQLGSSGEEVLKVADRLYKKLVRIRELEANYVVYLSSLLASILLYFLPNMLALLKLKLIEDKRDWEILNCIYVFSVFGRLPPFSIRTVLSNMLVVSDIFKPIVLEALNGVKSGNGEETFEALLDKVPNQELCELLEAMKLSMKTGFLDMVDNIDEMASNHIKWLEIKGIKRRKTKQVIAMLPVVLVMLLSAVYFSYSLSILSNPMNFIK